MFFAGQRIIFASSTFSQEGSSSALLPHASLVQRVTIVRNVSVITITKWPLASFPSLHNICTCHTHTHLHAHTHVHTHAHTRTHTQQKLGIYGKGKSSETVTRRKLYCGSGETCPGRGSEGEWGGLSLWEWEGRLVQGEGVGRLVPARGSEEATCSACVSTECYFLSYSSFDRKGTWWNQGTSIAHCWCNVFGCMCPSLVSSHWTVLVSTFTCSTWYLPCTHTCPYTGPKPHCHSARPQACSQCLPLFLLICMQYTPTSAEPPTKSHHLSSTSTLRDG